MALLDMHQRLPSILSLPISLLGLASASAAQQLFHDRGPGELLPPQLVGQPAARVDADLTVTDFLWAFHRDSLLPARRPAALAPGTITKIAAGLLLASRDADGDLRWQSLWTLARLARHDKELAAQLQQRILDGQLLRGNDATAEVACVAAGLAAHGEPKVLAALAAIATDRAAAERLRAFAFYGLGLAAQNTATEPVQFRVLAAVERALLAGTEAPTQVRVAALHALALTRLDAAPRLSGPALRLLDSAWAEDAPLAAIDFAAHVPLAVANVVPAADPAAAVWRERFAAAATSGKVRSLGVPRSCVLALGALCRPWQDASSPDAKYGEVLHDLAKNARDQQVGNYAWFAIGRAGGAMHRAFLLRGLNSSFLVKPWVAFGLAATAAATDTVDAEVVQALTQVQQGVKHPMVRTALTAALRVASRDAADDAAKDFAERHAGALLGPGDDEARSAALLDTLADAKAPIGTRQLAAMALGHLGDRGPRHWSAGLARAIDYRSGTPVLLGLPNGVLRLP